MFPPKYPFNSSGIKVFSLMPLLFIGLPQKEYRKNRWPNGQRF